MKMVLLIKWAEEQKKTYKMAYATRESLCTHSLTQSPFLGL